MKRIFNNSCHIWMIILFLLFQMNVNGQNFGNETQTDNKSCGAKVLMHLKSNYSDTTVFPSLIYAKEELTLAEMLDACKKISPDALAIHCLAEELQELPKPIILHLNYDHYILIKSTEGGMFHVYDPYARHIKAVSQSYLAQNFSGNAIILGKTDVLKLNKSTQDIALIKGRYMHEYPPPTQTEQGELRGDGHDNGNLPQGECKISRGGQPLLSFNPIILNLVASDIPMWYDAGKGPDIELKLVYNGNDKNEINGGLPAPTQYYPMGYGWCFSYSAFYKEETGGKIVLYMPDGQRITFTNVLNLLVPSLMIFYNPFVKYPVTGGYGYSLTMKDSKLIYRFDNPVHKKLTSITDRNGNTITLLYDSNHNLSGVQDANGRMTTFTLNSAGRIIKATDPIGREAIFSYGYTDNKFLTGITDMGGFTSTIEYAQVPIIYQSGPVSEPRIVSVTTPNGVSTVGYATGSVGPGQLGAVFTFTNPNQVSSRVEFYWDAANNGKTRVYDNNGAFHDYFVNLQNFRITNIAYPISAASVYYVYDNAGNKTSITKGTWETQFTYDTKGNITSLTDPRDQQTTFVYDANDNLTSITDPMNRTTTLAYNSNHNLTSVTTPVNSISFSYLSNGNLQSMTDPRGFTTSFSYNALNYVTQISFPSGSPVTMVNDPVGRATSITSGGVTQNYMYDALNQVKKITFPDGKSINYDYTFQNLAKVTDRGGRIAEFIYDGMSQVIQSFGPQGVIDYTRDGNGNILRLTINGVATSWEYDVLGRATKMKNPDGTAKQYTYDELGNLLTRLDEKGTLTTYTYDYSLLTQIDYEDNTPDVAFTYNNNSEVTSMTDVNGLTAYTYDNGGRVTSINRPGTEGDISYTYDNSGNRLTMAIPGMIVNYTYDNLNRLTNVAGTYGSAAYQYDTYGNLIKRTYGNGSYTDYTYDNLSRLLTLQNKKSTHEIFSGFRYTYDDASMIKTILDNEGNLSTYNYDYGYQLTEEKVEDPGGNILWHDKFTYDNMGNRLTQNKNGIIDYYENNVNNQLTSLKKQTNNITGRIYGDTAVVIFVNNIKANLSVKNDTMVEFTVKDLPLQFNGDTGYFVAYANGVVAEVDDSSRFVVHTAKYPNNQVQFLITSDTSGVSQQNINQITRQYETIYYQYDPNGNLISRISSFDTTQYYFDAENRLTKVVMPDDYFEEYEYDGISQRTKENKNDITIRNNIYDYFLEVIKTIEPTNTQYFTRGLNFGGGVGGLISEKKLINEIAYAHYNHRGDVINLTDVNNILLYSTSYEAFGGNNNQISNSLFYFLFASKDYSEKTYFSNFGYRSYSMEMSKWVSMDPIGFSGGTNQYRFTTNNPLNFIDLFGLFSVGTSFYAGSYPVGCSEVLEKPQVKNLKNDGIAFVSEVIKIKLSVIADIVDASKRFPKKIGPFWTTVTTGLDLYDDLTSKDNYVYKISKVLMTTSIALGTAAIMATVGAEIGIVALTSIAVGTAGSFFKHWHNEWLKK